MKEQLRSDKAADHYLFLASASAYPMGICTLWASSHKILGKAVCPSELQWPHMHMAKMYTVQCSFVKTSVENGLFEQRDCVSNFTVRPEALEGVPAPKEATGKGFPWHLC